MTVDIAIQGQEYLLLERKYAAVVPSCIIDYPRSMLSDRAFRLYVNICYLQQQGCSSRDLLPILEADLSTKKHPIEQYYRELQVMDLIELTWRSGKVVDVHALRYHREECDL